MDALNDKFSTDTRVSRNEAVVRINIELEADGGSTGVGQPPVIATVTCVKIESGSRQSFRLQSAESRLTATTTSKGSIQLTLESKIRIYDTLLMLSSSGSYKISRRSQP